MLDALKRRILNVFPLPPAAPESEPLSFCRMTQVELSRCQSRMDSIEVLFPSGKFEECVLLLNNATPRIERLVSVLVDRLDKANIPHTATVPPTGHASQAFSRQPSGTPSPDAIGKYLAADIDASLKSLAYAKKLFSDYRNAQPITTPQYAYVKKRLFPFAAVILLAVLFVSGLYAARMFDAFKDRDIRFNWLANESHPRVVIKGAEPAEMDGSLNVLFAWGMGPRTSIAFNSPESYKFELTLLITPCLKGQSIDVVINGNQVKRIVQTKDGCAPSGTPEKIIFDSKEGLNDIEIVYSDWNAKTEQYFPGEPRPLAARFYALSLKRTYEK